mgnify:CR=1 FL=1
MNPQLENYLFAIIIYLIEQSIVFAIFFFLMDCRFKHKVIAFITCVLTNVLFYMSLKSIWSQPSLLRSLVDALLFVLPIFIVFNDSLKKRFAMAICALIIMIVAEAVAVNLLRLIYPLDWVALSQYDGAFRIGSVLVEVIIFLLCVYFAVFWRVLVEKKRVYGEILFLFIPTYQLVLLIMYYRACREYTMVHSYFGIGVTIMGIIIDCSFMYFINGMERKVEAEGELSYLYNQRQNELIYYKTANQYIEEMREIRHDFKNQIQTAYIMLEQGADKEKIKQVLKETDRRMGEN